MCVSVLLVCQLKSSFSSAFNYTTTDVFSLSRVKTDTKSCSQFGADRISGKGFILPFFIHSFSWSNTTHSALFHAIFAVQNGSVSRKHPESEKSVALLIVAARRSRGGGTGCPLRRRKRKRERELERGKKWGGLGLIKWKKTRWTTIRKPFSESVLGVKVIAITQNSVPRRVNRKNEFCLSHTANQQRKHHESVWISQSKRLLPLIFQSRRWCLVGSRQ